jgi:SAM-dependent methyltransferase
MASWRNLVPVPVKRLYWHWRDRQLREALGLKDNKHAHELRFWRSELRNDGGVLRNSFYREQMLGLAGECDDEFLRGKIVADFGCGPRGTLQWATSARVRIGIDVLADRYSEFGISSHDMCYVVSTESVIPLPSNYVDVIFTLNALDHVANLPRICEEIYRVLAPRGTLFGSFNLNEPATESEPQTLTHELLHDLLFRRFEVQSYRTAAQCSTEDGGAYKYFFAEGPKVGPNDRSYLWVRATKKDERAPREGSESHSAPFGLEGSKIQV